MATTTGAVGARIARVHPPFTGFVPAASWTPSRRRLLSVVDVVTAYLWGRHPVVPPVSVPASAPAGASDPGRSGPSPYPEPAPVRPRPADKPATVAHYQALADQVANERRLAELDGRLTVGATHHGDPPGEAWLPPATIGALGGCRRG